MTSARVTPAGREPNNQDAFLWALHLLGGADRAVDVEEIFLKAFDIAPSRLGWRTRPDLPDYKKAAKALQSVEAKTHVGLVHHVDKYRRRLTSEGVAWIGTNEPRLRETFGGAVAVPAAATNAHERLRRSVRASRAFRNWCEGEPVDLTELATALQCNPASPRSVWDGRLMELTRAASVLSDEELLAFRSVAVELVATIEE